MVEKYTETVTTSWGKRIIGSFTGILFGLALFLGSFYLIWWNEGRSVDRIRTLQEGLTNVISIPEDVIDPNNEGTLVHLSGIVNTNDVLKDALFGVEENALKLRRTVQMYQWKESSRTETRRNTGGSETKEKVYSYQKTWSPRLINSGNFKQPQGHQNPSSMPYKSQTFVAPNITIGTLDLTKPFVEKIGAYKDYALSQKNFDAMEPRMQQAFKLNGNEYLDGTLGDPQIGDLRVTYTIVQPMEMSAIGKQENNGLGTYFTKNGKIALLEEGIVGAESMFSNAKSANQLWTWVARIGGFIMMWAGLCAILGPLKVIADVVPFVGSLIGVGIGVIAGVMSLVLSFSTMGLAWVFYRPVVGSVLLVVAAVFVVGGFKIMKNKLASLQTAA